MENKFSELVTYFELLASSHVKIRHSEANKHFYLFEIDEVLDGLRNEINYPAFIMEGYDFGYKDNLSDNEMKDRNAAFILLDHVDNLDDFGAMHEKWDELEAIGDDIIARMKYDKRQNEKIIRNLDVNSIEGTLIRADADNNVGIRFSFTISSPQNLEVDKSKWSDI